jgi:hypothetical protein
VQPEPVIYREEVEAILFKIIDISGQLDEIIDLLKGDDAEEEEVDADA